MKSPIATAWRSRAKLIYNYTHRTLVKKKAPGAGDMLKNFRQARVLVAGDVILDTYLHGVVERLSPEAPVPVLRFEHKTEGLGGGANVASGVRALGGAATLLGLCGNDLAGKRVRALLRKQGIRPRLLIDPSRPTTQKQRLVTLHHHQLARLDFEHVEPLSAPLQKKFLQSMRAAVRTHDVLVLSDYGKGIFTPLVLSACIAIARKAGVPTVLDPKPTGPEYIRHARGITLVTPNRSEGKVLGGDLPPPRLAVALAKSFAGSVLLTLGEDGMVLAERGKKPLLLPALTRAVIDVSGAGDTVVAVCALALAAGGSLPQAAELANRAASVVVSKPGAATLTLEELRATL